MNQITVVMLGKFDIIVEGRSALPQISNSHKSILLLKHLILNRGKAIPIASLIEIFWAEAEKSVNPENALKTMVSRIRSNLAKVNPDLKNCIQAENRSYMWSTEAPCDVDVFRFEEMCESVKECDTLGESVREVYTHIIDIYGGDLSYSNTDEEWIVSRSLCLHHLYLQTVYKFIDMLKAEQDNEMVIHVCRIALDIDAFDERLNLELMTALKDSGQSNAALTQYKYVTSAYYKYLGIEPTEGIQSFYRNLVRSHQSSESDLQTIRTELLNSDSGETGAFICEYSIFKDIYQLQLRNIGRQENKMFLALLSVENTVEEYFDPLIQDTVMRRLLAILKDCLRRGDTISRFSSSQYAILLPMMYYSNGYIVINRIKKQFYKIYPDNSIKLIFHFGSLDQNEPSVM
jgi:DNA-binding SARP family transcriptional activator